MLILDALVKCVYLETLRGTYGTEEARVLQKVRSDHDSYKRTQARVGMFVL